MRFLVVLCLLLGCVKEEPITPAVQREVPSWPDLEFSYLKDGQFVEAQGQAADYFKPGDPKSVKIKTPLMDGCQVRVLDGEIDMLTKCRGQSLTIDLGKYTEKSGIISMTVFANGIDEQKGYFYPRPRKVRPKLPVLFTCPKMSTSLAGGLSTCAKPTGFDLFFKVLMPNPGDGHLLYTLKCSDETRVREVLPIVGPTDKIIKLPPKEGGTYCAVGLALKQDSVRQSHIVHVRYYDPSLKRRAALWSN